MRFSTRIGVFVGCLGLGTAAFSSSACTALKTTELVAGVSTQVQVPRDLKSIRVDVNVGGASIFCRAYKVYDGKVQLPRSLGTIPQGSRAEPVTITISGYTEEFTDNTPVAAFNDCNIFPRVGGTVDNGGPARVLRRSRQPYVPDRILFVPMPLRYSCFDVNCDPENQGLERTCKGGRCVDTATDEKRLRDFSEDLLSGDTATCFNIGDKIGTIPNPTLGCMSDEVPAVVVDPDTCTYAIPGSASAPPQPPELPPFPPPSNTGLNVRIYYDGGFLSEVLDYDADEGFLIADKDKPQRFTLAPGLCDLVHGQDAAGVATQHRISAVGTSGACHPKTVYQPICSQQLMKIQSGSASGVSTAPVTADKCTAVPLSATPSELLVLVDQTTRMGDFYSDAGVQAVVGLSLNDPAFRTTQIGMQFYPSGTTDCGATNPFANVANFAVGFKPANDAHGLIASAFENKKGHELGGATPPPLDLDAALSGSYQALRGTGPAAKFNRRAVLLIGNHDLVSSCSPAPSLAELATAASTSADSILTYVLLLGTNAGQDEKPRADGIAAAGGTVSSYDARAKETQGDGFRAFQAIVSDLATCVYDKAPGVTSSSNLSFMDPATLQRVIIPPNVACTGASTTASGWGFDGERIRICGAPCTQLRDALKNAGSIAALNGQSTPPIPISATTNCNDAVTP